MDPRYIFYEGLIMPKDGWIGKLIETNTGYFGLVIDIEPMYPNHPASPIGMLMVMWNEESIQRGGLKLRNQPIGKVSPFSVARLVV